MNKQPCLQPMGGLHPESHYTIGGPPFYLLQSKMTFEFFVVTVMEPLSLAPCLLGIGDTGSSPSFPVRKFIEYYIHKDLFCVR